MALLGRRGSATVDIITLRHDAAATRAALDDGADVNLAFIVVRT